MLRRIVQDGRATYNGHRWALTAKGVMDPARPAPTEPLTRSAEPLIVQAIRDGHTRFAQIRDRVYPGVGRPRDTSLAYTLNRLLQAGTIIKRDDKTYALPSGTAPRKAGNQKGSTLRPRGENADRIVAAIREGRTTFGPLREAVYPDGDTRGVRTASALRNAIKAGLIVKHSDKSYALATKDAAKPSRGRPTVARDRVLAALRAGKHRFTEIQHMVYPNKPDAGIDHVIRSLLASGHIVKTGKGVYALGKVAAS
jgi:DNA-binding HxlR family transcriptional regulator